MFVCFVCLFTSKQSEKKEHKIPPSPEFCFTFYCTIVQLQQMIVCMS